MRKTPVARQTLSQAGAGTDAAKDWNMIPNATENSRLDDLNAYNSTLLNGVSGDALDAALSGEVKRRGRNDADMRTAALTLVHPDDLTACLARNGVTLASQGIASIAR